jgi:predicted Fe-Mo cluster-binding NifX family protein
MSYKIAVATSDGIMVDLPFGAADSFKIYEVDDNKEYYVSEIREYVSDINQAGFMRWSGMWRTRGKQ